MGIGYKEASHFLRNIGLGDSIAILDIHILRRLRSLGVINEVPRTLTRKKYLEIEVLMRDFSGRVKIPLAHMDLLFWSMATGKYSNSEPPLMAPNASEIYKILKKTLLESRDRAAV
jgi:N-glycosylase/DNA lyase